MCLNPVLSWQLGAFSLAGKSKGAVKLVVEVKVK